MSSQEIQDLKPHQMKAKPRVFIDGEAGTTGLGIRARLDELDLVEVLSIAPEERKNPDARREQMKKADLVILCLPDDAARESVQLASSLGEDAPRLLDASTAHRVSNGWVYGFPELDRTQADKIARASKVANPGCYATGAIALLRPLVSAGLIPDNFPITINAVSGYSGGGRAMIEEYDAGKAPAFELYGLGLMHKHLPEIKAYGLIERQPIFVPSVGNFRQGMLVSIPLFLGDLPGSPSLADLHASLAAHYSEGGYISVAPLNDPQNPGRIDAQALNDTNALSIHLFGNAEHGQAVLIARLDNLGKGASGAAIQNLRLMLDV